MSILQLMFIFESNLNVDCDGNVFIFRIPVFIFLKSFEAPYDNFIFYFDNNSFLYKIGLLLNSFPEILLKLKDLANFSANEPFENLLYGTILALIEHIKKILENKDIT